MPQKKSLKRLNHQHQNPSHVANVVIDAKNIPSFCSLIQLWPETDSISFCCSHRRKTVRKTELRRTFFLGSKKYPPETNIAPKVDGWNTSFLLGCPIFRCYVSFREGSYLSHSVPWFFVHMKHMGIQFSEMASGESTVQILRLGNDEPISTTYPFHNIRVW